MKGRFFHANTSDLFEFYGQQKNVRFFFCSVYLISMGEVLFPQLSVWMNNRENRQVSLVFIVAIYENIIFQKSCAEQLMPLVLWATKSKAAIKFQQPVTSYDMECNGYFHLFSEIFRASLILWNDTSVWHSCYMGVVGVTKPSILLFFHFVRGIKVLVTYCISCSYLTGFTAAKLQWHLLNMNVY